MSEQFDLQKFRNFTKSRIQTIDHKIEILVNSLFELSNERQAYESLLNLIETEVINIKAINIPVHQEEKLINPKLLSTSLSKNNKSNNKYLPPSSFIKEKYKGQTMKDIVISLLNKYKGHALYLNSLVFLIYDIDDNQIDRFISAKGNLTAILSQLIKKGLCVRIKPGVYSANHIFFN